MEKLGLEFRMMIAYLIPGTVFLYGLSYYSPTVNSLLYGTSGIPEASVIFPIIILSIAAGMTVNATTWAIIKPFVELTSLKRPNLDYSKLSESHMHAFQVINNEEYRYYQSYSNMFTSGIFLLISYIIKTENISLIVLLGSLILLVILFLAARDSLTRAYKNMKSLIDNQPGD